MNQRSEFEPTGDQPRHGEPARGKRRGKPRRGGNRKRKLMMQQLESRQLLAADFDLPSYDGPRNIGQAGVTAVSFGDGEGPGVSGQNDFISTATFLPFGTGPGQQDTIDLTGSLPLTVTGNDIDVDVDVFAFDLRAGDIIDFATLGSAGTIDVLYGEGTDRSVGSLWFATEINQGLGTYPGDSPLMTVGNSVGAQTVPVSGRYYLRLFPQGSSPNYTVGMRAYRPTTEFLPIGHQQQIFLDFDGHAFAQIELTGSGEITPIRFNSLRDSLPALGIFEDPNFTAEQQAQFDAQFEQFTRDIIATVEANYESVARNGSNGDFDSTGIAGQYGVKILNSLDDPEPAGDSLTTRVIVGGESTDILGAVGLASSVDVGNFSLDDLVAASIDLIPALAAAVPQSPLVSDFDFYAAFIGGLASHEAGHVLGIRHTNNANALPTIMDSGGIPATLLSLGPDGIFGTVDDGIAEFQSDQFAPAEGFFGVNRVPEALSWNMATGTRGMSVSGFVYSDLNRDGNPTGDPALAGITVFSDTNGNGLLDEGEVQAISQADGRYFMRVPAGTNTIRAVVPEGFVATGGGAVVVSGGLGASVTANLGLAAVNSDVTGTTYIDTNGDGVRQDGEGGLEGIYIYADLDGDDRPDLGEPNTTSLADGTYVLNLPGPGTYTIRQVIPDGFEQTFPENGEHTFVFTGGSLPDNFDFGLLPTQDFGDAPASYGVANHGIISGLALGTLTDRESGNQPSAAADGDDNNGIDDEDGVRSVGPLGAGSTGNFELTVTNTATGTAFVQAWMDFNRDGDFFDAGERVLTDQAFNTSGTVVLPITLNTTPGDVVARFRISQDASISATGFVQNGEVEDYVFTVAETPEIVNPDAITVPRNSQATFIDVLANDFNTPENPLTIDSINTAGTDGVVVIAQDGSGVFYTPSNGFTGLDTFQYTVVDQFGQRFTTTVSVTVQFQTADPIAVDDTFTVPTGSSAFPLNVLANDIVSAAGGLTIIGVTPGSGGGVVSITGGGQTLRYTPNPGFGGTEQFNYSIQDAAGSVSTAEVTVNLLPTALDDDRLDFSFKIFNSNGIELTNPNLDSASVFVGDEFFIEVSVEDLETRSTVRQGAASAFLDLLYSDTLVSPIPVSGGDFNFDITFGEIEDDPNADFFGQRNFGDSGLQVGDANTPGLFNEIGSVRNLGQAQSSGEVIGPEVLLTIGMQAIAPGVAVFQADPPDDPQSENIMLSDFGDVLEDNQLRLGNTELLILPRDGENFTAAVDDSYFDSRDSDGNLIDGVGDRSVLRVLANDNLGPTGTVTERTLFVEPQFGNAFFDDNGTPLNLNDDFISYQPNPNDVATGEFEAFSYLIVTEDGVRSIGQVSIPLGNSNADALVDLSFALVDAAGNPNPSGTVSVGETFGVEVIVDDLRNIDQFVFSAFLDVIYDQNRMTPANTNLGDEFDGFDVVFNENVAGGFGYLESVGTGSAGVPGVIDEFGTTFDTGVIGSIDNGDITFDELDPAVMATLFFVATAPGNDVQIVGSPADDIDLSETTLFGRNEVVPASQIRLNELTIDITGGSGSILTNAALRWDVNGDGSVSPRDALAVIGELMNGIEGESGGSGDLIYADVNADKKLSPSDALEVIIYLAENIGGSAEGEGVTPGLSRASDSATDSALASFGGDDDDDDDDDLLGLIAGDVGGLY